MPELPEVETVRTGLARSWIGKRIDGVDLRREGPEISISQKVLLNA